MIRSGKSLVLIICALLTLLLPANSHALDLSLKGKIQSELDANPFLREQRIKLQVVKEENGYVTIEMAEGNRKVREAIDAGVDVLGAGIDNRYLMFGATENELKTVNALKRSLAYVKKMEGVKEVQVVAAVNTRLDRAEELLSKGLEAEEQKEVQRAAQIYEKAQELGSIPASVRLGQMYLDGKVIPKNAMRGIALIRRAAEQGDSFGQFVLGGMYLMGNDIPEDGAKAAEWLRKAAEQGAAPAQLLLGEMLETGMGGLPTDKVQADVWFGRAISQFRESADRGDSLSQYVLGSAYASGSGVVRDCGEAIKWLEKSKETSAQATLAWVYATCPEDRFRDHQKAVHYAETAYKNQTGDTGLALADTLASTSLADMLAAAYARAGQFDKAAAMQRKAIYLLREEAIWSGYKKKKLGQLQRRLDLYLNKQAYVDTEGDGSF